MTQVRIKKSLTNYLKHTYNHKNYTDKPSAAIFNAML